MEHLCEHCGSMMLFDECSNPECNHNKALREHSNHLHAQNKTVINKGTATLRRELKVVHTKYSQSLDKARSTLTNAENGTLNLSKEKIKDLHIEIKLLEILENRNKGISKEVTKEIEELTK